MIHPTAHVHPKAKLASNVQIGPGVIIDEHVTIGENCEIRAHAVITGHTTIGNHNQIGYGAIIGAEPQDHAFDFKTISYVRMGDHNIIREYATIHRGTQPETATEIGNHCFLMGSSHLAHNCKVKDGAILANHALCAGYVEIGEKAFISGNTVIHQFCRVGRMGMLRGGGRISKDIPPFMIGDATNRLMGLNSVALKRAQFSLETRMALKRLYHELFLSEKNLNETLKQFDLASASSEIKEIIQFIQTAKKGVVMPEASSKADDEE
ncbi:MAG: acyl-ACP--UDP-N-acetylglucosamine O-acyltransferase [Verrucomicrobiae bacterium]|nr:acyl-ACP--UDP-N-acetylglucosamine O-acyltransferase [Verrucomicrobiae bacterium]